MSYLITGGTGFIGAYVARMLVQKGETAILYDSAPRQGILDDLLSKEEGALARVIRGDITDLAHLIRTAKEHNCTTVVHLAALLSIASSANPSLAVRINCDGTANILELARILSLEKVVYASSNTVFGPPEKYEQEYIPDDAPHYPSTVYGACKSFNERLAAYYFDAYGVDSIGLRFPVVYGLGHREGAASILTEELVVKPALGRPGRVPYGGDQILNWLYVEDAARGVVLASKAATTKTRSFNIDGEICSMTAAVGYVKKRIPNADITFLSGTTGFAGNYDTTRIREEIGYRPEWTLEKGIDASIRALQKRKEGGKGN